MPRENAQVFHPACGRYHSAETLLDENAYPVTRWLESCAQPTKEWHLEQIALLAGRSLSIAVPARRWDLVEQTLEQVLARNDPAEEP